MLPAPSRLHASRSWLPTCHPCSLLRSGSLQLGDLLSDLHAAPMEVDIAGADGWVHQVGSNAFTHGCRGINSASKCCPTAQVLFGCQRPRWLLA